VVPELDELRKAGVLRDLGLEGKPVADMLRDERLKKAIVASMAECGTRAKLQGALRLLLCVADGDVRRL